MGNSVKFKFGSTTEGKTVAAGDIVAVNKGYAANATTTDSKYGSIYRGDKILGTTEADKLVLTDNIVIAGGPLANDVSESSDSWPSDWKDGDDKILPAGASVYDILTKLFCVEKWPVKSNGTSNISTSGATLVSTVSTPSLTYNGKTAANSESVVEVGSSVSYEAKSGSSSYTATPHKASGFTYGYSTSNDNTKDSKDTSESASFGTVTAVSTSVPTLTLSGAVTATVNGTAGSASTGAATKSGTVVIAEGDNKIKAQSTSITYTGTCSALAQLWGCSNLGNTSNDGTTYTSTAKTQQTLTSSAVSSNTIEINCKGTYKAYVGYVAAVPTTSDGVTALNNGTRLGKGTCGTAGTLYTITNDIIVVAVPTGWNFTIKNSLQQATQRDSFKKSTNTVPVKLPNGSTRDYDVWSLVWSGGQYMDLVIV